MAYRPHKNAVDDLVLLSDVSEKGIYKALEKHYSNEEIYVYIGDVLLAVNPYKMIKGLYSPATLAKYPGRFLFDNAPHVYATSNTVVRNMRSDRESQCVIISGESGAGKTETAKKVMEYVSAVSSNAAEVERTKSLILESNPLLEAFGNAKTVRNNNSSRFGKYFEIQFDHAGDPRGGKITNYLLEKSRIVGQSKDERNFHIFYQLIKGASAQMQKEFQLGGKPEEFAYLNKTGCYKVDNVNDQKEFADTQHAMQVVGMSAQEQTEVFRLVAAVLHIGNVAFKKDGNKVVAENRAVLKQVAAMVGSTDAKVEAALTHKTIKSVRETIQSPLEHTEDAVYSRDSLAKAIYARLFDHIVAVTNTSMKLEAETPFVIGVLDIYGFEIFDSNSFEQLCINFVNEKLQQIFIELTLKKEQDEYVAEGIKWQNINYYNNLPCCELVEKRGMLLSLLDEECLFPKGTDASFLDKIQGALASHPNFGKDAKQSKGFKGKGFVVKHFAGDVAYDVAGFLDKNKDQLLPDLVALAMESSNGLLKQLFQEDHERMQVSKKKPVTAGFHFKQQVQLLMDALKACVPHYIRCIKPNEQKRAGVIEKESLERQIKYLGLLENVKVRRAGYAFRLPYDRFLRRYKMLSSETWPMWTGDARAGCEILVKAMGIKGEEIGWGKSKVFVKSPETVFTLESKREEGLAVVVTMIQRCYRSFASRKWYLQLKTVMQGIFQGKKQRRKDTLNRTYHGDYLTWKINKGAQAIMASSGDKKIIFSDAVLKVNRKWKGQPRKVLLTDQHLYNVEDKTKKGGPPALKVKRVVPVASITGVSVSQLADPWIVIHIADYDYLYRLKRKTELCVALSEHFKGMGKTLNINFSNSIQFAIKGKKKMTVEFKSDAAADPSVFKAKGSTMTVGVPDGLDAMSAPRVTYVPMSERRGR